MLAELARRLPGLSGWDFWSTRGFCGLGRVVSSRLSSGQVSGGQEGFRAIRRGLGGS